MEVATIDILQQMLLPKSVIKIILNFEGVSDLKALSGLLWQEVVKIQIIVFLPKQKLALKVWAIYKEIKGRRFT